MALGVVVVGLKLARSPQCQPSMKEVDCMAPPDKFSVPVRAGLVCTLDFCDPAVNCWNGRGGESSSQAGSFLLSVLYN